VKALAGVTPLDWASDALEEAVRCILFESWSGIPMSVEELESLLPGTWSGDILRRMQEHHALREVARRARQDYENPINVQMRREEKKRVRRSRAWYESHEKRN
jgi:hypothetical protein